MGKGTCGSADPGLQNGGPVTLRSRFDKGERSVMVCIWRRYGLVLTTFKVQKDPRAQDAGEKAPSVEPKGYRTKNPCWLGYRVGLLLGHMRACSRKRFASVVFLPGSRVGVGAVDGS